MARARAGEDETLDRLLGLYRGYLKLLARTQIEAQLRVRLDPSDLVQETMIEAYRDFARFRGATEPELMVWLRRILARNLADQLKRHRSPKRDLRREQSLEAVLDRSSKCLQSGLAGLSTPSRKASRREQTVLLADALERLPEDYRRVIIWRHLERVKFAEIAHRMGRTSGAVRMLWARALERLRHELEGSP
jgi:RNA polymerase sigma-70 factor (ECF subfamily)